MNFRGVEKFLINRSHKKFETPKNLEKDFAMKFTPLVRPMRLSALKLFLLAHCLAGLVLSAGAQSFLLNPRWAIAPNSPGYEWVSTNHLHRGLAYNASSGHVLNVSRHPNTAAGVYILSGTDGSFLGNLNVDGVFTPLNFPLNLIDVAEDGAIYACNLAVDSAVTVPAGNNGPFRIYRWADENAAPTVAYVGDPSNNDTNQPSAANRRFGDSFAVRGSGPNTQILASTRVGKIVAFFTTTDGTNFTSRKLEAPDMISGSFVLSIAFGQGNEFYVKPENSQDYPLLRFTFDPVAGTATLAESISSLSTAGGPMEYDPARKLFGLVGTKSHLFRLYKRGASGEFFLQDQPRPFPTTNGNGNFTGAVAFGSNSLFALDSNNGILAFDLIQTNFAPVIITSPGNRTVLEGASSVTLSVVASGTDPFTYQWQFEGANIANATNSNLILSNVTTGMSGNYRVVVSNFVGTATSGNALVTVTPLFNTGQMTNIWNLVPGSRPYLTTNYTQYGLAYNPVTTNLLLVTRTPVLNIHVLNALTGVEKHILDLTAVGGGSYPLHKVDVADDGGVFACNITFNASTTPFRIYHWADDQPATQPVEVYIGDPASSVAPGLTWGRELVVRGTGTGTEILVATATSNYVAVMRFTGGVGAAFPETTILQVPGVVSGFARLGLAWGKQPNTFWAKAASGPLYLVQFDPVANTSSVVKQFDTDVFPGTATTLAYDATLDFLGTVEHGTTPKNVRLYDVKNLNNPPVLIDQEIFMTENPGIEASGAMEFGPNLLFVLDTNNGIKAFRIDPNFVPSISPFRISNVKNENGNLVLTWDSISGRSYNIEYKTSLTDPSWTHAGTVVAAGGSSSYSIAITAGTRYYRVVAP